MKSVGCSSASAGLRGHRSAACFTDISKLFVTIGTSLIVIFCAAARGSSAVARYD
jgi:hypothetical protein